MTRFEDDETEYRRLTAMGRHAPEDPSPRLVFTAKVMRPWLWSAHADEHVRWAVHHRRTGCMDNFGAQFLLRRRLALIQAEEVLRQLARHDAGLPDLEPLDANALSSRLKAEILERSIRDRSTHVSFKAADAVFFMRSVDGIAAPAVAMSPDGSIDLSWTEEGRSARLHVDVCGVSHLITSFRDDVRDHGIVEFQSWKATEGTLPLIQAVDWIHHGAERPAERKAVAA